MRVSRIYVVDQLNVGSLYELNEDNAHYVRTVLRLKKDQSLILFNGLGGEYVCNILEVSRKNVRVDVLEFLNKNVESSLQVTLGLGITRGDRMDWAVQKSVELGVNYLTPLITERCVVKFKGDKKQQRWKHWAHIIQHATEQCHRTILPTLGQVETITDWLDKQAGLKVFLDPYADKSLVELQPIDMKVTLLSGPEGGFSSDERDIAVQAGFIPIHLGKRVLRAETASLAALSAVQTLWGDFA